MLELLAGVFVTVAALALVLEPLIFPRGAVTAAPEDDLEVVELEESASPKVQALLALQEIEFDHATGKLSDDDFNRLKTTYTERALAAIKTERGDTSDTVEDEAERIIQAAKNAVGRTCPACGPRPEVGAVFCSQCGRTLSIPGTNPRCPTCGVEVLAESKFCSGCGAAVSELELEALHSS
jgi:predicted RNA-binding Zn-ribbon protein involved in translation (DUF1610 family)